MVTLVTSIKDTVTTSTKFTPKSGGDISTDYCLDRTDRLLENEGCGRSPI